MRILFKILLIFFFSSKLVLSQGGWMQQFSGTSNTLRSVFMLNENTGYSAGTNKVLKTTDGGSNWFSLNVLPSVEYCDIQFIDLNTGYLAGFLMQPILQKTTDGGQNWISVDFPNTGSNPNTIYFFNSTTGFVSTFKTTNGGINWINNYSPFSAINKIFFINENTGWGCGNSGTVIKTTNSGNNWSSQIIDNSVNLTSLCFVNSELGWSAGSNSKIYKTTNSGAIWFLVHNTFLCGINSLTFVNESTGWTSGCEAAIHKTTNGGTNWTLQSFASTTYLYDLFFVNNNSGWSVGAGGRILKTTNGGLTFINPISNEIPESFSLAQNYPNPFNPTTNLEFGIAELGFVTLKIYDAMGREVKTLINETLAPGSYNYQFSTINYQLVSGVYFYKLEVGKFTETKRMILLK